MEIVTTSKGRVVIPSKIRQQLGIKEGTHFQVEVDAESKKIVLIPITREYVHSLRGKYKGKGLMKVLRQSRVDELVDKMRADLEGRGESLESMSATLRKVRTECGHE
jgi:AbrB family looped-hinge helix DNA binding protein